jgi:hypothetical protein
VEVMTMAEDGVGGTGYSLEDLSDYLDRGREPRIDEIESDPECQAVLASLGRMGALSRELVSAEAGSAIDEGFFDAIMREVAREVRAGRDIPLAPADDQTRLVITEGAVRAMLREIGDLQPGVIVERTRISGDVTDPDEGVRVEIVMSVAFGRPMQAAADTVREIATEALARHTALSISAIDVTVDSVHGEGGGPA